MKRTLEDKILTFLKTKCLSAVKFDLVEVSCTSRLFKVSTFQKEASLFVPLIKREFAVQTNEMWKQWQSRNSFPKYKQSDLYDVQSEYARDIAFGKPAPSNIRVGPQAYSDLSACLKEAKTGSFVYVGVHGGTYVPAHDNKSVYLIEPVFLFAALLRLN